MRHRHASLLVAIGGLVIAACSTATTPATSSDARALAFSGDTALEIETRYVTSFPNRHSGTDANIEAVSWFIDRLTAAGLECTTDSWDIVNYSEPVRLTNGICRLRGESDLEILYVAHHDQSPATVQGADNDGSGIAIITHTAEIMAAKGTPNHTLVFLSSDGEEYGMLGSRRYITTHPNPESVVAAVSHDNLGKELYDGLFMDPRGQFRGYGDRWLQTFARDAAEYHLTPWIPRVNAPIFQILDQAVPISFMDEGPFVAAGVPSFGFAGTPTPGTEQQHWDTYHTPDDLLEHQSAESLGNAGLASEALLLQLLTLDEFPRNPGPYIYDANAGTVLRGPLLWLLFIAFAAVFAVAAWVFGRRSPGGRDATIHFLSLWTPMVLSVVVLYLFVAIGLMDTYELYPSLAKGPEIFSPIWPAVLGWIAALGAMLWAARKVASRYIVGPPQKGSTKRVAFLAIAIGAFYLAAINPFSLVLIVPLLAWLGIGARHRQRRFADIALFLTGGLMLWILLYFFGFVILRNGFAVLWYIMMMFSIGMVSFVTAMAIAAFFAGGLTMVVTPPRSSLPR